MSKMSRQKLGYKSKAGAQEEMRKADRKKRIIRNSTRRGKMSNDSKEGQRNDLV